MNIELLKPSLFLLYDKKIGWKLQHDINSTHSL